MSKQMVLMQGNEACVYGAIAAGMRFYAGYPITPSTEIAEFSAVELPKVGGKFMQMEDEISSMAAIIGASAAGFSLKQENIGYASFTELPCVIVNVQRSGPSTGMPTSPSQADVMQTRWGTHGDHPIIVISPSSVPETYNLIIRAFNLSEKYRVPVIFLMDEIVGHMREGIVVPDASEIEVTNRAEPDANDKNWLPYGVENDADVPKIPGFGKGYCYHITGLAHDKRGYPTGNNKVVDELCTRLMRKLELNRDDIVQCEQDMTEDADVAVVCFGGTKRAVKSAIDTAREQGIKAGMFRPITIWPFPEKELLELSKKVKHIIVAEHNYGQISLEVERIIKNNCGLSHIGKVDGTVIMPDEIVNAIKEVSVK